MIHAFTTGYVKITENWVAGKGIGLRRLVNTLMDKRYTEWLPIWCFVIEREDGLIVIDTGISTNANDRVYFPPYMPLVQRAAKFDIFREQELDAQMLANGLDPADVHTVILTHLHQDHDGGLHHFPNAEFIVSQAEWDVATGLKGRMGGYLNHRWFDGFNPTQIQFTDGAYGGFEQSYRLADDIILVPTHGHSDGHLSVIVREGDVQLMFVGDATYSEHALINTITDGVTNDLDIAQESMARLLQTAQQGQSVIMPSHDPQSAQRLQQHYGESAIFLS